MKKIGQQKKHTMIPGTSKGKKHTKRETGARRMGNQDTSAALRYTHERRRKKFVEGAKEGELENKKPHAKNERKILRRRG
jgi:hypothetical protein